MRRPGTGCGPARTPHGSEFLDLTRRLPVWNFNRPRQSYERTLAAAAATRGAALASPSGAVLLRTSSDAAPGAGDSPGLAAANLGTDDVGSARWSLPERIFHHLESQVRPLPGCVYACRARQTAAVNLTAGACARPAGFWRWIGCTQKGVVDFAAVVRMLDIIVRQGDQRRLQVRAQGSLCYARMRLSYD